MKEIYRSPVFNLEGYNAYTVKYSNGTRKTILEHREKMERHLGRKLSSNEIVHHKDENKKRNVISNFKLTNKVWHGHKHRKRTKLLRLVCLYCHKSFLRSQRFERHNRKMGKRGPYCSRRCVGKVYH